MTRKPEWKPSNLVIKGRSVCNNTGCQEPAEVAFEQGDAVWKSCKKCKPDGVKVLAVLGCRVTRKEG